MSNAYQFHAITYAWVRLLPVKIHMSNKRLELSKVETQLTVNLASHAVVKQITHNQIDPDMVNLLKKATKLLQSFNQQTAEKGE